MPAYRPFSMSLAAALTAALLAPAPAAGSTTREASMQQASAQQLIEAGKNQEALQAVNAAREAGNQAPDQTYLAGQAHLKSGNTGAARDEFGRLQGSDNEAWRLIGQSAIQVLDNNGGGAMESARRATEIDGNNPWAHYQLGLAAAKQGDFGASAGAFERALQLKGDIAYAHYYAAQAFQKQNQLGKTAEHFEAFLNQAPEAPERVAVLAIMRTLK